MTPLDRDRRPEDGPEPNPDTTADAAKHASEDFFFFRAGVVKAIVIGVAVVCAALAVGGLFMHWHGYFDFETWPVAYGLMGFVSYTFIVLTAKGLRKILRREEDYYAE